MTDPPAGPPSLRYAPSPAIRVQFAAVLDGAVRLGPLMGIPPLLREFGQDPQPVFASAGVDLSLCDDPENTVAFTAVGRLLAACVAATGCGHFGLRLGQGVGLDALGLVGDLARHSASLEQALRNIVLHLHLHDRGAIPTLSVKDTEVHIGYAIYQPGVEATAQIYDLATRIGYNMLRVLCGPAWQPRRVLLPRTCPADPSPYRSAFGIRPHFGDEQASIVFSARWLAQPIAGADPERYRELTARIQALSPAAGQEVAAQVRRVTCNFLLCGGGSLEAVSDVFSLHPRTLNRQLQGEGTTYRDLRDDCRQALAFQFLSDTALSVAEIAARLDYADAASFTRAFRRWTGVPPAAWRAARRGG